MGRNVEYIARIYAETARELRDGYSPGWDMSVQIKADRRSLKTEKRAESIFR